MAQAIGRGLLNRARSEIQPVKLLSALLVGAIVGSTEVIFALSMGSLIFSGELATYLPYGIGLALVTVVVMLIVTALTSLVPGVIGSIQDSSSVLLAVIVASLATDLVTVGGVEKLFTILFTISITTILTGCLFLLLGYFKLGRLVHYIPYPVVGGFLAGTGWLLVQGSFGVMAGIPLTFANLDQLTQPDQQILWLPGVLFALVLFLGLRRIHHLLALPGVLVGSVLLFYLVLLITNTSMENAIDRGLLLGSMGGNAVWQPFILSSLRQVDWMAVVGQSGNIAIVMVLSVISLLLNASALELAIQQDIRLNRELLSAGFVNILSGLLGGMIGYHALSLSTLSHRIGGRGRSPGVMAGLIAAGLILVGSSLLIYFPKPILGGLLFFLGLDFLADWLMTGWKRLSRGDYAIVVLILVVIAATNFLVGVSVGLVASIILFILNYSRINIVHHALSGAEMRSNVERCAYHQRVLAQELGQQIYILELEGFLFFGTANALLDQIRSRVEAADQPSLSHVLLDFRRVTGLDSSAVISFVKGKHLAEAHKITLVLTHLTKNMRRQLELDGISETSPQVHFFPDLDHGLEWCETQLLEVEQVTTLHTPVTLSAQLADSGFEKNNTRRLLKYLERVTFQAGESLLHQGGEADRLYFIEMGSVSVYLELDDQQRVRLQTLGLGTAVGEPGLYLGTRSSSSVMADSAVTAYLLTRTAMNEMKEKEPDLAAAFHELSARLLSERLNATTKTLEAVLR